MNEQNKVKLVRLLQSLPAAVPYAGDVYNAYLNAAELQKFDLTLEEIKTAIRNHNEELMSGMGELTERFLQLSIMIERESPSVKKSKLTVVIPCGGLGGNLFPMTQVMPKVLVLIKNKSLLQHIIDSFYCKYQEYFEKIIVVTGKYHDAISYNIKQGGYGDFVECYHAGKENPSVSEILIDLVRTSRVTDRFVLHYNDILIPNLDWGHVVETYVSQKKFLKQIGMLLCSNYYPLGIGVITGGEPNLLGEFVEKPQDLAADLLANTAVGIFEKSVIDKYCESNDKSFFCEPITRIKNSKENIYLHRVGTWFHVQDWNALYRIQNDKDLLAEYFK